MGFLQFMKNKFLLKKKSLPQKREALFIYHPCCVKMQRCSIYSKEGLVRTWCKTTMVFELCKYGDDRIFHMG